MGQTRSRRREKKEKKSSATTNDLDADFIPLEPSEDLSQEFFGQPDRDNRSSFFGLLDRSELEYFKQAESVLATNALLSDEKDTFISNIFAEARGKELKLATNQVCSKLFERLVQLSNEEQITQLTQAIEPFVVDLSFQKYSSHCVEAVIKKALDVRSCEDLLVSAAERLKPHLKVLLSDQYASHVLATVLLTFSGLNADLRSKKSQLARKHTEIEVTQHPNSDSRREVTPNLKSAGRGLLRDVLDNSDKVTARNLAIQSTTTALIQALILAEAAQMSSYKLLDGLVMDEDSEGFISHCTTDPIGSHFLESAIRTLPAKKMNKFLDRISLSKLGQSDNECSVYLAQAIISDSNLSRARKLELLHKELGTALGRRTGLSIAALDLDFELFAKQITESLDPKDFSLTNSKQSALIEKLSKYRPFVERMTDSIVAMPDKDLAKFGTDPTQSFVLQSLLQESAPLVSRRKLVNKLISHVPQFVVNAYGSHVIDSLWNGCFKLKFARERVANELLKIAEQVKHSSYGSKVWKNWHMEKYARQRHDWWGIVHAEEDELRKSVPDEPAEKKKRDSRADSHRPKPAYETKASHKSHMQSAAKRQKR